MDDGCCFDVEIGDQVSVMIRGTDVFANAVVICVSLNALTCECPMKDSSGVLELQTAAYFYDEFTLRWNFGWIEPRTRAQHHIEQEFNRLSQLAEDAVDGDD